MVAVLEVNELRVRYGAVVAVDGVSMRVPSASCTGLIGPNGSGKTTLFSAVAGFVKPEDGSIVWKGRDIVGTSPEATARLGIVRSFQQAMVFPSLSVLDCLLAIVDNRHEADALLRLGGMSAYAERSADTMPYGLTKTLGVLLALALQPKLLLLDEPTSGLSSREVSSMVELLSRLRSDGIGMWVIDHNIPFITATCDSLVVLDAGRVLAAGEPQEVLRHSGVQAAYIGGGDLMSEENRIDE